MDISLQQAGQSNFNLPHDVIQLPSGGIFYKSKKKSVKVGYLTAADENIIVNSVSNPSKENIILSLIRNKLYETDIRPDELTEGDIEAIMIFLRNTSFGPEYKFTLIDPATDKTFEATVLLDELDIIKPNQKPDENGHYVTKLPKSGVSIKLRPLSYTEIIEISKMAQNYPVGRVAPIVSWRLAKQILEMDGSSDRSAISQFSETMPISDSKYIRKFLEDNEPRLDLTKQIKAPSGEIVNVKINFGVEFFRPFF
jgi:hypothetical protein